MKTYFLLVPLQLLPAPLVHAAEMTLVDEEAQIVTTCYYANAEWGTDMINRCVEENQRLRAEVLALPAPYARAVARCRASSELGWNWVKTCVTKEVPDPQAPVR